jgi:hypothetical protein
VAPTKDDYFWDAAPNIEPPALLGKLLQLIPLWILRLERFDVGRVVRVQPFRRRPIDGQAYRDSCR